MPGCTGQKSAIPVDLGDNFTVLTAQQAFLAMLQPFHTDAVPVGKSQGLGRQRAVRIAAAGIGDGVNAGNPGLLERCRDGSHRQRSGVHIWEDEVAFQ